MNKKALKMYDTFHLFIPKDGDENDVEIYSHSQGDWEILKRKQGQLWTMPITILDGYMYSGTYTRHFDNVKLDTPYDLWQFATAWGALPRRL